MIALVPLLLLAGVVFVEQPLDGLAVSDTESFDPQRVGRSWRCADLDGDGAKDILTPTGVAFQRDGQFPKTQQTPFPNVGDSPRADVWKNEIFVQLKDRIEVLRWAQGDWQRTLSQPIAWTNPARLKDSDIGERPQRGQYQFERFLHDIDNDGKPEIVVISTDGLRVYSKGDLFYEEKALWPVFPTMQPHVSSQVIWPTSSRIVEAPLMLSFARFQLENKTLTVFTNESHGTAWKSIDPDKRADGTGSMFIDGGWFSGEVSFKETRYSVAADGSFALSESPEPVRESQAISMDWGSVRLNDDDVIDLVRVRYAGSTSSPYPISIFEVAVSTDGGKSIHTAQCTGAYPKRVVVDFNRDGRLDLVTESKQLAEGGIKETLVRGLTRREVDLDVEIRLQNEQAGFPAKPSFRRRFTVTLDKPPAASSKMFLRFLEGEGLRIDGDVDGDRFCDAVIHDRPGSLSVYKGSETGITNIRIATLPAVPGAVYRVVDVDEDGRSDILVNSGGRDSRFTVYLSRDTAP